MPGFFDNLLSGAVNNDILRGAAKGVGYAIPGVSSFVKMADMADVSNAINDPNIDLIPGVGVNEGPRQQARVDQYTSGNLFNVNGQPVSYGAGNTASDANGALLGANVGLNGLPSGQGGGSGYSQGFLNSLLQQAGQGIQQQYEGTLGQLQSNADFLGNQSKNLINQAGTVYDQQKAGFDSQRQSAQQDLDRSQSQIDTNRQDALADLTGDLRSQMESFTRMVGALGAGDSSATGMGQYAFGRLGQQARSDIWKQANQLSSDMQYRRGQVNDLYQQNLQKLNDWKVGQLDAIRNDYDAKMQQIEQAKMSADQNRLAQLNDIQIQIQQQAMTTAMSVDQQIAKVAEMNKQWAANQAKNLDSMQQQLTQSLQALNLGAVQADPMQTTAVQNTFNYTPQSLATQNTGATQVALPTNRKDDDK